MLRNSAASVSKSPHFGVPVPHIGRIHEREKKHACICHLSPSFENPESAAIERESHASWRPMVSNDEIFDTKSVKTRLFGRSHF